MSDMDAKWDKQWHQLLTHCHGEEVEARSDFKVSLLAEMRRKMSDRSSVSTETVCVAGGGAFQEMLSSATADATATASIVSSAVIDDNLARLLQTSYTPCHADNEFKSSLLIKLKNKQRAMRSEAALNLEAVDSVTAASSEDATFHAILSRSYETVNSRPEFQNRLLDNLKERQRHSVSVRNKSRRRAFYLSTASGLAAAAMVMFAVWVSPPNINANPPALAHVEAFASLPVPPADQQQLAANTAQKSDLRLTVPDEGMRRMASAESGASSSIIPAGYTTGSVHSGSALADVVPASYSAVPAAFADYRVTDAFKGEVLPRRAYALQNIETNLNEADSQWSAMTSPAEIPVEAGMSFRSTGTSMGHMQFADGSLLTMSPNSLIKATVDGLMVVQGFMLLSVPEVATNRFRLHFAERDLAVEPGTDLAVMVENPDHFAEGGAPAPMVMVVDRPDSGHGGLALARGKNGVGPLFAQQLYRLDHYVTADLPSRTLCDTESQELNQLFKCETVRQEGYPKASFAGGFSGDRDTGSGTTVVLTPAGYHKRGSAWVSDNYRGQETIKLHYLSDAYFGFANARRDLARDLALGGEVVIDGGDGTFYEIVK